MVEDHADSALPRVDWLPSLPVYDCILSTMGACRKFRAVQHARYEGLSEPSLGGATRQVTRESERNGDLTESGCWSEISKLKHLYRRRRGSMQA